MKKLQFLGHSVNVPYCDSFSSPMLSSLEREKVPPWSDSK